MFCQNPRILIVDDEEPVCDLLSSSLSDQQYRCTIAFNAEEAVGKLGLEQFDVALLDIRLPGVSGMELLKRLRSEHPEVIAIMVTAVRDVDTAVEAMKLGAASSAVPSRILLGAVYPTRPHRTVPTPAWPLPPQH